MNVLISREINDKIRQMIGRETARIKVFRDRISLFKYDAQWALAYDVEKQEAELSPESLAQ